ncbi:MAG: Ig-like domain-containing protein, partial [Casimicrobiaceae bacterium]
MRAYDSAGAMTASQAVSVTVAANAPPSVALAAPAAGSDYYEPATVILAATATDPDGSIARVEFRADGNLIGTALTTPYVVEWESVAAGSYSITATAYDGNGAAATTTPVSLVVKPPVSLNLIDLADGTTIDDDRVLIRGYLSGPDNSSITVNGVVAHLDDRGFFQLNDTPLAPGANVVDAVVTTQDGRTASRAITVNSSGPGAFVVDASPTEGIE